MAEDVALVPSKRRLGKLTFEFDESGDLRFDDTQAYAVLTGVVCKKDHYRWDGDFGTDFYKIKQDRGTTGSRLSSAARDGGDACRAAGLITEFSAFAERLRAGRWRLNLTWRVPGVDPDRTRRSLVL